MENNNIITINSSELYFEFLNSKQVGTKFKIKNKNNTTDTGILIFKNYNDAKNVSGICMMIENDKGNKFKYYRNFKLNNVPQLQVKEHEYSKNKEQVAKAYIIYKYKDRYEEIFKNITYNDLLIDPIDTVYSASPVANRYEIDIQSELSVVLKYKDKNGVALIFQKTTRVSNYYNFEDWIEWVKILK